MKAFLFLIPLMLVNACKPAQTDVVIAKTNEMEQNINKLTGCPEDGTCSIEVYKNKTLTMIDDGTGALYPELIEGDAVVLEYTYFKAGPEGTVDGNYSETIHFELPQGAINLKKENASLSDVKLVYGKHCFCKGEAGYYSINEGKLLVDKTDEGIAFELTFNVGRTSQVVTRISEMVKLK